MVCCIGGNIFFEEKRAGDVMMWWERLKVKAKSRRERERATAEIGGGGGEANSKDTKNLEINQILSAQEPEGV